MTLRTIHVAALATVLAVAPLQAATLFGLVDTGELFASSDNGATWLIHSTLPVHDAIGLAASRASYELYVISRSGSVYYTPDAGGNWIAIGAVSASDVVAFVIRADGALVVLSETGSLWEWPYGGEGFSILAPLTASNLASLAIDASSGAMYALTATGEVSESLDDGASWSVKGAMAVSDAVEIQSHAGALYVITSAGDTYRSTDAGASWTAVGTLSQVHVTGLTSDGDFLIAALEEGEVAISSDGSSWTWRGAINQLSVIALATDTPAATGVEGQPVATGISLRGPWPNPGPLGSRILELEVRRPGVVTLALHDVRGRLVARTSRRLDTREIIQVVSWDPGGLLPGVYLLRVKMEAQPTTRGRWVVVR